MFGIPELNKKNMGIDSRSITQTVPYLYFKEETYKKKKFAVLFTGKGYSYSSRKDDDIPDIFTNYKKDIIWYQEYHADKKTDRDNIMTAWDDKGFGVAVMGENEVNFLKELYEAFNNLNVVIAIINLRVNNPFAGSSLSLMIKDKVPQDIVDLMYDADKKYLDDEFKKMNIVDKTINYLKG